MRLPGRFGGRTDDVSCLSYGDHDDLVEMSDCSIRYAEAFHELAVLRGFN
jgi:hypothetical protein